MGEKTKLLSKENLKCLLYAIFDNYSDLSKKVYIVTSDKENYEDEKKEILDEINENTPCFIKKILSGKNTGFYSNDCILDDESKNLFIVDRDDENLAEIEDESIIKVDILNMNFGKARKIYSYESRFVVEYLFSLDKDAKDELFGEFYKEGLETENLETGEKRYLDIDDLYNICISKTLWKTLDDNSKMVNWIYNTVNPNKLNDDLFDKMLEVINEQLNNYMFNSYLKAILSKQENKSLEYISPSSDLYELLLFEDILSVDYRDKYKADVELDVDYIGDWWRQNILPIFKAKYKEEELNRKLMLEIKKNEILDFYGENFNKFKNKIIDEVKNEAPELESEIIEFNEDITANDVLDQYEEISEDSEEVQNIKEETPVNDNLDLDKQVLELAKEALGVVNEVSEPDEEIEEALANENIQNINEEALKSQEERSFKEQLEFEKDERNLLKNKISSLNPKNLLELEQIFSSIELKYDNNKKILRDYCSDKLMEILDNKDQEIRLKSIDEFVNNNKEFLNEKVYIYIQVYIQKEIQKIEENLLNDICDVKDLKALQQLHNKILSNGEFVKCEDIESIIFTKMESIIKIMNLAEINDQENIKIGDSIYDNTSSIDIKKYPLAEILICRDINIDLNNPKDTVADLKETIDEIKETVLKNCMFNYEYYNLNIQVNDGENFYTMKFKYLSDLIDYIKIKEGNALLLNLKNINKNVQFQRRVFNKANSKLIEEINTFYDMKKKI